MHLNYVRYREHHNPIKTLFSYNNLRKKISFSNVSSPSTLMHVCHRSKVGPVGVKISDSGPAIESGYKIVGLRSSTKSCICAGL
jgi:hypothetical protein